MNLVFTGFMGTGKTVIGKIVAEKLSRSFFDTDSMIEDSTGQTIKEIFKNRGEKTFRKIESETVSLVAGMDNIVISCGGGAVINPENIANLKKNGIIVNLFASPEHLLERILKDDSRPLLAGALNPLEEIKKLLKQRQEAYKNCDFAFNTEGLSPEKCAQEILNDVNIKRIFVNPVKP